MPRSRNIKPGFFKSEQVAECSFEARLLFVGLWGLCDFRGVMEYRPKQIKAVLFAYDSLDIEGLLKELSDQNLVALYHIDIEEFNSSRSARAKLQPTSSRLLAVPEFLKHQHPHWEEKKKGSILPTISQIIDLGTRFIPGLETSSLATDPSNPADSGYLIPDSLPVSTKQGASPKVAQKARSKKPPAKKKPSAVKTKTAEEILASLPKGFVRLWEIAPEQARIDQVGAAMAYHKLIRTSADPKGRGPRGVELGQIIQGLKLWATSEDWLKDDGKFIPSLKKFFHDEQWKRKPREFKEQAVNPGVDGHDVDPKNKEGMIF